MDAMPADTNCRVAGQQDVLPAAALPAASSEALSLSQALPTPRVAASQQVVRRKLAESPAESPLASL